jgi:hypothetical protein
MKCFECNGEGKLLNFAMDGYTDYVQCFECGGRKDISVWHFIRSKFWRNAPVWFVEWYGETFVYSKERE